MTNIKCNDQECDNTVDITKAVYIFAEYGLYCSRGCAKRTLERGKVEQ